ncbi:hypothetical protein [Avibacterium volantium]|uniref:Uncharacterized protein n=1 Tax=Avibacterium volantium TaxID=762 RepID=A0A3S4HSX6_AVIVO|nr:hypothetical protein [Avibacterium volantium]VEB23256.1 Uncharacterised protein [Avibacterium volantium]
MQSAKSKNKQRQSAVLFQKVFKIPPHFKFKINVKYRDNPLVNCPNGNKIFRKVTPERSEASMGLLFVKKILLERGKAI